MVTEDINSQLRLWRLYLIDCETLGVTPSLSDYEVWKEEM